MSRTPDPRHALLSHPRRVRPLIAAVILALVAAFLPRADVAAQTSFQRFSGQNRYEAAAATSAAFYAPGVPVVYVARGDVFADALASGPAAAAQGGPTLIVQPDSIPPAIAAELQRLAPSRIVIAGGPLSVSPALADALAAYQTGGGVTRLGGADRYEVAARISASVFSPGGRVYIATGVRFPDALTGGAAAARDGAPMLLVRPDVVPPAVDEELRRLQPSEIVIVGGPLSVSEGVAAQLGGYTTGAVTRITGGDRYEVAIQVARQFAGVDAAFLATGRRFPDAAAAIPPAAQLGAPVLITPGGEEPMHPGVEAAFGDLAPASVYVVGGPASINNSVVLEIQAAIEGVPPLPACTYDDVLTPLTGVRDWPATIVDTRLMVSSDYVPPNLVSTANAGLNGGYEIRSLVIPDLAALASAAAANGTPIEVISGYRSYETQVDVFNYWVSVGGREQALRTSARPGHSEHQLGTTLGFTSLGGALPWEYADWGQTPAGAWMAANAWRYGFVMSYPPGSFDVTCYDYEPWHYRYYGRDVARLITESGLTPREWLWQQGYGVN